MAQERSVRTVDPATGRVLRSFPIDDAADVDRILDRACVAFAAWSGSSIDARAQGLRAIARELRAAREEAAQAITAEMGKTLAEAQAEIDKCVWVCEHYADYGERYLAPEEVSLGAAGGLVRFLPIGPVLAIMPWNYPFWQVFRAGAPVLAAGNALVLKHASNVTGCALLLAEIVARAGLPDDLLQVCVVPGSGVAPLIADPRVSAVTFTGSESVGIAVGVACARNLKKSVLELGGSDPFIVLDDADIEAAARAGVKSRFQNAGQSCIAAKRFIVTESVAAQFVEALVAAVDELRVGDPLDPQVAMGPMARRDLRDELALQVDRGRAAGGRAIRGGASLDGPGAFYAPTLIADVDSANPLFLEETFGPAAAIVRARCTEEAIVLANATTFGLSASLWTADQERSAEIAARLEAGSVFVNAMSASDPRMPIGGVKRSGWGRELSWFGIREFANVQALTITAKEA